MATTQTVKIEMLEKLADGNYKLKYPKTSADMVVETADVKVMTLAERTKLANVADNANNYTHPTGAGNLHMPTGGSVGQVLKNTASGTATWQADADTIYTHPTGAGNLHMPTGGSVGQVLKNTASGTATWQADADTIYTHPTGAGNNHIPTGGTTNDFLQYSSSGDAVWSPVTPSEVGLGNVANVAQMPIAGGAFTGIAYAQNNTSYTIAQTRNVILATTDPTGGSNGDVWIKYVP